MTEFTLTFKVQAPSSQKAAAMRDKTADWLNQDPDIKVINQSMAQDTQTFTVVGVDVAAKQPFTETVEATSHEDAEAQAIGKSKTKVVALVSP